MANFSRSENIHWCRAQVGKSNPMALKRKAIGPDGQVVEISLANGKADTRTIGNTYAQMIQHEKEHSKGWVWYEACEACGPAPSREERGDLPGDLCERCVKREALIEARQSTKAETNAEYLSLFEDKLDKLAKLLERQTVNSVAPQVSQADLSAVLAPEPKRRGRKPKSEA